MRIFYHDASRTTAIFPTVGSGGYTSIDENGIRFTGRQFWTLAEVERSPAWVEMTLVAKPLPTDEEAFPYVIDRYGDVWTSDPKTGGWWSRGVHEETLDDLDTIYGPLTRLGVAA